MLISDPTFDLTTPGIESVHAMYAQPLKGKNLKGLKGDAVFSEVDG